MTDTLPRPRPRAAAPVAPTPTLTWAENRLMRDGASTRLLSGSVHYFRIHPDQWRDRLQRVKDLGLNTVDTYVPWNFHQPRSDEAPDFTGWRDLERFLLIAADLGLDATVRPGPYICAEWSNGGLPVWLTARGIPLRSSDERFLGPVREWFSHLLPRIAALQANVGGPVVAVQVENEFGSFGDDRSYPAAIARGLSDHGITELLFTADGPTELMLDAGAVDGVLQGLTLGSRVGAARDLARTRRPDEPLLVAEYWNGWFDHWGHPHHVRGSANAAETLAAVIEDGGSVALYMAHGGTNFGLWAGANRVDGELRGTVTSYDSDAPISEDGTLTEKFHAMREVLGTTAPIVSLPPRMVAPQHAEITVGAGLGEALASLARAPRPVASTVAFEDLGQDSGMLLLSADVMLPTGEIDLVFPRVADRAMVRVDGRPVGTVAEAGTVTVTGAGAPSRVDVVIDNLGRVNYGWSLGERKGLLDPVLVQRRIVQKWQAASIDVAAADETTIARLGIPGEADAAGGATAVFHLPEPADGHLALPGFARGFVWINGFLLGRYWEIGPQQTLYVPAPLLRAGANVVTVLELERRGTRLELRDRPELGPEEEYIEHF